jgi:glutathione S-transferase
VTPWVTPWVILLILPGPFSSWLAHLKRHLALVTHDRSPFLEREGSLALKLYQYIYSDSSMRVRIYLAEKGIEVPFESVDISKGESHTPAFLAKNPLGQVPVLELDDGSYLAESIAICRYFEELHPEPSLFGRDPKERAEIEMWSRRVELTFAHPVQRVYRLRFHSDSALSAAAQDAIEVMEQSSARAAARFFDQTLAQRNFLAGADYSIADIMALCTYGMAQMLHIPLDPDLAHLRRWYDSVSSRPSARA